MVVVSIAVVVIGMGLVVLLSSQVELFRDTRQMREITGLLDEPIKLDLGAAEGVALKNLGLGNGPEDTRLVLVLSDRCSTCRSLAASLDGAVPRHLQVVLSNPGGRESELPLAWQLDRAVDDSDGRIMNALGINTVPAALVAEDGRLVSAQTVPSSRQLHTLLDATRPSSHNPQDRKASA